MLAAAIAVALAALPASANARGVDRLPEREIVLVQAPVDGNDVVWHEDQMCFCEWRHTPPAPEDHYRAVRGVPIPVRDDFGRSTVDGVESATF